MFDGGPFDNINVKNKGPLGLPRLTGLGPLVRAQVFEDITPPWFTDHAIFKSPIRSNNERPYVTIPKNERDIVSIRDGDPLNFEAFDRSGTSYRERGATINERGQIELDRRFDNELGDYFQFFVQPKGTRDGLIVALNRFGKSTMSRAAVFKAPITVSGTSGPAVQGTGVVTIPKRERRWFGEGGFPSGIETRTFAIELQPAPDGPSLDQVEIFEFNTIRSEGQTGDQVVLSIPVDVMRRRGWQDGQFLQVIAVPESQL